MSAGAAYQPNVDELGVPRCATDECCQYDGKRCRLLGARPGGICEPAVVAMAERLRVAREFLRAWVDGTKLAASVTRPRSTEGAVSSG